MKKRLTVLFCMLFMLSGLMFVSTVQESAAAADNGLKQVQNQEHDKLLTLVRAQNDFLQLVKARTQGLQRHVEMQKSIADYAPTEKIRAFLRGMERANSAGLDGLALVHTALSGPNRLAKVMFRHPR